MAPLTHFTPRLKQPTAGTAGRPAGQEPCFHRPATADLQQIVTYMITKCGRICRTSPVEIGSLVNGMLLICLIADQLDLGVSAHTI